MNDVNHSARSHATWSASATARNVNCAGALAFIEYLNKPEKESEAAAWGSACHEVAERCFKEGKSPDDFIGEAIIVKSREFIVDDEMAETAEVYTEYVNQRLLKYRAETGEHARAWHEENFSLAAIKPPFDAGGTADTVMYFPKWRLLEVVDLKGGRGVVVEVKNNGQARSYSLGAILNHKDIQVDDVMSTIVQPRAPHKDGRIRSETLPVGDLLFWASELKDHMLDSWEAKGDLKNLMNDTPDWAAAHFAQWKQDFLKAGDHCKFCPAMAECPAAEKLAMDAVGLWWDDMDSPRLANAPSELSNERLAQALDAADMVGDWLKALASEATYRLETGQTIENYVLVKKEGRRAWKDQDDAIHKLAVAGLAVDDIFNQKIKSPAQIEKILGAKRKAEIADLWEKPDRGVAIARADKTTRQKAVAQVDKFFSKMED